jgi:hypothetical protein
MGNNTLMLPFVLLKYTATHPHGRVEYFYILHNKTIAAQHDSSIFVAYTRRTHCFRPQVMNKLVFLVLAILCVGSSYALESADVELFVIGFAEKLAVHIFISIEANGNNHV